MWNSSAGVTQLRFSCLSLKNSKLRDKGFLSLKFQTGEEERAVLGKPANTGRRWTHSPVNQRPLSQLCSEITRGKEAGAGLLASETLVSLTQLYTAGTWPCDWDVG